MTDRLSVESQAHYINDNNVAVTIAKMRENSPRFNQMLSDLRTKYPDATVKFVIDDEVGGSSVGYASDGNYVIHITTKQFDGDTLSQPAGDPVRSTFERVIAHEFQHVLDYLEHGDVDPPYDPENPNDPAYLAAREQREEWARAVENEVMEQLGDPANAHTGQGFEQIPGLNPPYIKAYGGALQGEDPSIVFHGLVKYTSEALEEIQSLLDLIKAYFSPLILDLDNDGIELTDISATGGAVYFDVNNNGYAEATAWFTGGDGMLTIDLNADNLVQAEEIFGNSTGYDNGFLALAQYDVNADGKITAEDAPYDDMRVWIDANVNGYAEEGELTSLADMLITEISLAYTDVNYQVNGNDVLQESTFVINGNTRDIADAYFATDQTNSVYDQDYTLDPDVLFLPTLRGYGTIADMHIAASIDNTGTGNLKSLLETFSTLTLADAFASTTDVTDDVRAILYRWAGVDAVSPTARGGYADAALQGRRMFKARRVAANAQRSPEHRRCSEQVIRCASYGN